MTQAYQEYIFHQADMFFESLIHDIDQAKHSIDIEVYIFSLDKLGEKIIDHLIRARHRGVSVRVLVDGAGSIDWGGSIVDDMTKHGIESKVYHPLPWRISQFKWAVTKHIFFRKLFHLIINMNIRNHRKVIIIDHQTTYIGSHNIDYRHLSLEHGGEQWRDTSMKLVNASIRPLQDSFNKIWGPSDQLLSRIQKQFSNKAQQTYIRLNDTLFRRRINYKNLLKRIARAENKIWIASAYFIPTYALLKKLKDAADRGVDVRILLPQISDIKMMPWISEAFYSSLRASSVRIFEYIPSVLHAKITVIDNWAMIGTSNFNHRSIMHDLEVDLEIQTQAVFNNIQEQFSKDFSESQEILDLSKQRRTWVKRLIGRCLMSLKIFI